MLHRITKLVLTKLSLKLLIISELVLIFAIIALLLPIRQQMRGQIIDDVQQKLLAIANTGAAQIDGDLHQEINNDTAWDDPAFQTLRGQLARIRNANPEVTYNHIYTFHRMGDRVYFAVFLHDEDDPYRPRIGESYELQKGMRAVFEEGRSFARDLYTDQYGEWISAYAPIRNSAGSVVGLLEVDEDAPKYFARYRAVTRMTIALGLAALAVSSILGWFVLQRLVISPLRAVHDGMQALSRQDFGHHVGLKTHDEFQDLGETLNSLATELNAASKVQAGFFPRALPAHSHYRIAASSIPCEAVGGDYYDVIELPDRRIALLVADVSGHGLGPSLIMASCRSALRALVASGATPAAVIERLDEVLADDLATGHFITMLFGILDAAGNFIYANAGHGPAMVVSAGKVQELGPHRAPLGVPLPPDEDEQTTIKLRVGDRLFISSDGVSEAATPGGELFGHQRIAAIISDTQLNASAVVDTMSDRVNAHLAGGKHTDDITMICVDRI